MRGLLQEIDVAEEHDLLYWLCLGQGERQNTEESNNIFWTRKEGILNEEQVSGLWLL